ncbi:hypothetical protein BT96DRAFT_133493 [Gymnopus androsaceus JB14]|uniref:DNA helicase Pif1-like 2B domain-containing protein n=1 Tax=Gymnopus androsaceus JB14 TaxID=1447944 RepID=A0A6A4HC57_9AGAR|nr:hypothetical protein BT96DRAFT_133493 [Gymnopus androsaceus JB14]
MRVGNLSDDHIKSLAALSRPLTYADGIEPTSLFPTRMEAQACNSEKLNALSGQGFTYNSMDASGIDVYGSPVSKQVAERILDDEIALSRVTFKVGAQVMLIQNIVQGCLVNGSCGKVIDFMTTHDAIQKQIQIAEMKKTGQTECLGTNQ